jgi:hypothetical protein
MQRRLSAWVLTLLSLLAVSPVHAGLLVIDTLIMHSMPQLGTALLCFTITQGAQEQTFHLPDKEFSGEEMRIAINLQLANINIGDAVQWAMGLDDTPSAVCSSRAEEYAEGSFLVRQQGAHKENPKHNWSFIIHYHLQPLVNEQGENRKPMSSKKDGS